MSLTWDELDHMLPKRAWRTPLPPTCGKCSYNLTGLTENRCPECGTPFKWKDVQKRATQAWTLALRLRYANQDAKLGVILGLSGWLAIGLVRLAAAKIHFLVATVHLTAFIAGVLAIVLGAQMLNLRRVPHWLRTYISDPPPRIWLGAGATCLGLSLIVGALLLWPT